MATVESRKKAREEYLRLLQQQKESASNANGPAVETNTDRLNQPSSVSFDGKVDRREQILAEKRKAFFDGKQAQQPLRNHPVEPSPVILPTQQDIKPVIDASDKKFGNSEHVMGIQPPIRGRPNEKMVAEPIHESEKSVNIADWKKLGFLSEYAFAKHLGLLEDKKKDNMSTKHSADSVSLVQEHRFHSSPKMQEQHLVSAVDNQTFIMGNKPSHHEVTSGVGGEQLGALDRNLPALDQKQAERAKKLEYAMQLQQQINDSQRQERNTVVPSHNGKQSVEEKVSLMR